MYCKKCNLTFDNSFKYCNQCGSELISNLDALGQALVEDQEGAFERFYEETNPEICDHLYHRVPLKQLESALEEFYTKLLIDLKSFHMEEENFTEWFYAFVKRFILKYTGIHQLFNGDELDLTELAPNLTLPEIRIEKDIAMRAEKRVLLLGKIMEGVEEKERICLSLRYIEQMSLREIAREMHTTENIIAHYFYTGNEKIYHNFNQNEIAENNNLFGMNSLSFIIWLLQYDDFANVNPIDPKKILNAIKVKNPEEMVAEYKALEQEEKEEKPVRRARSAGRQVSYQNQSKEKKKENEIEQYEGYDAPESSGGAANTIIKVLIGICTVIIILMAVLIVMSIFGSRGEANKEDQDMVTTTQNSETEEETTTEETKKNKVSFAKATKLYKHYLEDQGEEGIFYAIVEAGEDSAPMMIVADNDGNSEGDNFLPSSDDVGYNIVATYILENEEVIQLSSEISQAEEDKAWRLYDDQLSAYYTQNGSEEIRTMEISGDSYKLVISEVPSDYEEYAEVIELEEFRETDADEDETETTTEEEGQIVNYDVVIQSSGGSLNVRAEASTDAAVISKVKNGTQVTIVREKNGWGELSTGGWVYLAYTVDPSEATTQEVTIQTTEVTTEATESTQATTETTEATGTETSKNVTIASPQGGGLNVHSDSNTSSSTLRVLKNGENVTVVKIKGEWGQLADGGWIYLGYTK